MKDKTSQNLTKFTPYKAEEYKRFIELVGTGQIPEHWEILAETLGVTRQTIAEWKKMPEFKEAINRGIDEALTQMKIVGRKDWKMWRERFALLTKEKQPGLTINADKVVAILGGNSFVPDNNSDQKDS